MMIKQDGDRKVLVCVISWKMIGLLLYLFGILWIFLFPAVTITKGEFRPSRVYRDENALTPGFKLNVPLNECDFQASTEKKLKQGLKATVNDSRQTFCSEVNALGFACHEHVHTRSDGSIGRSVYSVLHRRNGFSDRKDCVVLSAPLYKMKETNQWDGMYILLAVVRAVIEDETWMSKNMLLLGVDEPAPTANIDRFHFWEDTKSFLEDYHSVTASSNVIKHAGVIRAAISLDLPPSNVGWNDIQVMTTGFNGELPNMDLPVLVVDVMRNYKALPYSHRSILRYGPRTFKNGLCDKLFKHIRSVAPNCTKKYLFRFQSLFVNLVTMAFGPTGPHAQFLRHSIDAVTIHGSVMKSGGGAGKPETTQQALANSVASCIRSLSGLEEDLHHSMFYYYLIGYKFYLSLGEFIWPIVIMLAPLLFSVLIVFSKLKQVPWLHGILIMLLFETYGVVTLVLVGSVHKKFGDLAEIIRAVLFIVASPLMAYVARCLPSKILVVKEQGLAKFDEDWISVKGSFGSLVVYFIPVCAIVNFAFAVWFTASMVLLLASAQRFGDLSYLSRTIMTLSLVFTSPYIVIYCHIFFILGQSPNQLMSYWIHGWNLEGLMIFPCLCLVYLPSHMMATTVCLYPKRRSSSK